MSEGGVWPSSHDAHWDTDILHSQSIGFKSQFDSQFQFPVSTHPGGQQVMVQAIGFLPPLADVE